MVPLKKRIVQNLCTNYLTAFLGMLLGFLLVPFLIRKLGRDAYGVIVLAESTIAFFEMAAVSVRTALARYVTVSLAQDREGEFYGFLGTARTLLAGSAVFVFLIGTVLSLSFEKIFQVPATLQMESRCLFFLISLAFAAAIPNMAFWSVLYAKHQYPLINLSSFTGILFRALSAFLLFTWLPGDFATVTTYGGIYVGMVGIQNLMVYRWVRKLMPELDLRRGRFDRVKAKTLLGYGGFVGLSQVSGLIYQNAVAVAINLLWGPAFNAIYAISLKFPSLLTRIFEEATWSLTSTFSEWAAVGDREKMRRMLYFYTKFLTVVTVPISVVLMFLAKPLIALWVGPDFALAARLLPIHLVPLWFQLPLGISGCVMQAYAKIQLPSIGSVVAAALSLAAGILLGKVFRWGLLGMAVAVSTGMVLYLFGFSSWYGCKISGISVLDYWRKAWLGPWLWSAAVSAAGVLWIQPLWRSSHYALAAMVAALGLGIHGAGVYALLLDPYEKEQLDRILGAGRDRLRQSFSRLLWEGA